MTEAELQKDIVESARQMGWYAKITSAWAKTRPHQRGLPDVYLSHTGKHRQVWMEVKPPSGGWTVTDEQQEFIDNVRESGGEAYVVDNLDDALEVLA